MEVRILRRSRMTHERLSEIAEQLRERDPEFVTKIEKEFDGFAGFRFDIRWGGSSPPNGAALK